MRPCLPEEALKIHSAKLTTLDRFAHIDRAVLAAYSSGGGSQILKDKWMQECLWSQVHKIAIGDAIKAHAALMEGALAKVVASDVRSELQAAGDLLASVQSGQVISKEGHTDFLQKVVARLPDFLLGELERGVIKIGENDEVKDGQQLLAKLAAKLTGAKYAGSLDEIKYMSMYCEWMDQDKRKLLAKVRDSRMDELQARHVKPGGSKKRKSDHVVEGASAPSSAAKSARAATMAMLGL